MKIRIDKDILQFFGMSSIMILIGVIAIIFFQSKAVQMFGAGIILSGLILTLIGLYNSTKPKSYFMQDERSIRIDEKAGYQAFWITILTISILGSIDIFWKLNILFKNVASILFMVGIVSWAILKWHYNKRNKT